MISIRWILSLVLALFMYPSTVMANDTQEMLERLKMLEKEMVQLKQQLSEQLKSQQQDSSDEIDDLREEVSAAQDYLDSSMRISGYADVEYKDSDKTGSNPGFRMHHFSLFLEKQLDEKLNFFSEIEFEDGPNFESASNNSDFKQKNGKIFLEAVNLTYKWRPAMGFRIGRFFTPVGIWSEDHYPPFVGTQERPMFIRKIFPQVVDGISVRGSMVAGSTFFSYEAFSGNGEGNTGNKDENSTAAVGFRTRLQFPQFYNLMVGADFYDDTLNDNSKKQVWGAHAKIKPGPFTFQAEYAIGDLNPTNRASFNAKGFYLQTLYDWSNWTLGYRYDVFDQDDSQSIEKVRNSLFLNYHYSPNTVFKMEFHNTDIENGGETNSYVVSVATYLGQ